MRPERWMATTLALVACASSSTSTDLEQVEGLARLPLPQVADAPVDPETDDEVAALLAEPLNSELAVKIALINNRGLRAELRDLGISRGQLVQAGLLPNPRFEFDLRLQEDRAQPLQADFLVEIDLTRILLTPSRSGVAKKELEAARYRAAATIVDVAYRAKEAYFGVAAAEARRSIAEEALRSFAAGKSAAQALFDAGNLPEIELAVQDAAYESARATVAELELDVWSAKERLQRILGLHGAYTEWKVEALPAAPEVEVETIPGSLEKQAIEASLELKGQKERIDAVAEKAGLVQLSGWLPDISVDAHAEQDGTTWELGGGASIVLPLFDHRQGDALSIKAELGGMLERYYGDAIDVRSAAREASNRLRSSHLRARQYQQVIVPARKRVTSQSLLQYNGMQLGLFRLLEVKREELDAELRSVTTLEGYWVARASFDALLAGKRVDAPMKATAAPLSGAGKSGGH